MLAYYTIHDTAAPQDPAKGICVLETSSGEAVLYNHRTQAWEYNPELVNSLVFDLRRPGLAREVDRATAEQVAARLAPHNPLPAAENIQELLARKETPPGPS